jgi:hypothetical protein
MVSSTHSIEILADLNRENPAASTSKTEGAPRQKSKRPMKAHHPCLEKLLIQFLFRFETSVSESSDHSRDAIKAPR